MRRRRDATRVQSSFSVTTYTVATTTKTTMTTIIATTNTAWSQPASNTTTKSTPATITGTTRSLLLPLLILRQCYHSTFATTMTITYTIITTMTTNAADNATNNTIILTITERQVQVEMHMKLQLPSHMGNWRSVRSFSVLHFKTKRSVSRATKTCIIARA